MKSRVQSPESKVRRLKLEAQPAVFIALGSNLGDARSNILRAIERLQQLINPEALSALGLQLQAALSDAAHSCAFPNEATKLRTKR